MHPLIKCTTCGRETENSKFCSNKCRGESVRGKINIPASVKMKALRQCPNNPWSTESCSRKKSERAKEIWNTPGNLYRSDERARKVSKGVKIARADPTSKYNSPAYLENHWKTGYGKYSQASDGHLCSSTPELTFDEWLIGQKLEHLIHPQVPGNMGRRADFLCNNNYIEVDGMKRDKEYWIEKYKDSNINPIILKADNVSILKNQLDDILLERIK